MSAYIYTLYTLYRNKLLDKNENENVIYIHYTHIYTLYIHIYTHIYTIFSAKIVMSSAGRPRVVVNGIRRTRTFHHFWCSNCQLTVRTTFSNAYDTSCPYCADDLRLELDVSRPWLLRTSDPPTTGGLFENLALLLDPTISLPSREPANFGRNRGGALEPYLLEGRWPPHLNFFFFRLFWYVYFVKFIACSLRILKLYIYMCA